MGKFEKLVDKFKSAQEQIKSLGSEIVDLYPNSPKLVEMAQEIGVATTALDTLLQTIEDALQNAEVEEGIYKEVTQQMDDSDIYQKLKPAEREKIAEYLTQTQQRLADQELLLQYVEKSLSQKSTSDLIAMYPKAKILERGSSMDDGTDAFDAYTAGMDAFQKDFETDKAKAVKDLSKVWLDKGLEAIAREFYAEALRPKDEDEEQ